MKLQSLPVPDILKQSLVWKIMLIFWITIACTIFTNVYITKEIVLNDSKIEEVRRNMRDLANEAVNIFETQGPRQLNAWYKDLHDKRGFRVVLLNARQKPLGVKRGKKQNGEPSLQQHDIQHLRSDRFEDQFLKAADQNIVSKSGRSYTLRLLPSPYLKKHFGSPEELRLVRLGSTFLFIFIGSLWLAWSFAKPVSYLRKASEKIAEGNFRVDVSSQVGNRKDELGKLANTFDNMAVQIEQLMSQQRRLFGDISHEIRTPLTRQKLAIELARTADDPTEFLDKLEQQNQTIERLVDDILTLIRLEEDRSSETNENVDLDSLLNQLCDDASLESEQKHLEIVRGEFEAPSNDSSRSCVVVGNERLITRALENILINAIKYSPEYGKIHISTKLDNNTAEVSIIDEGPGIPETDIDKVLEPFYRADKSRNKNTGGFGLGLSIVSKIMKQQGGSVLIANCSSSQSASGLKVTLRFPV